MKGVSALWGPGESGLVTVVTTHPQSRVGCYPRVILNVGAKDVEHVAPTEMEWMCGYCPERPLQKVTVRFYVAVSPLLPSHGSWGLELRSLGFMPSPLTH